MADLIAWQEFDWPSFATLVTGIVAVVAAAIIGNRQVDIQKRQVFIHEAELRTALFDKRYAVFEKAEQFIREIIQLADDPSPQTQREFVIAMGEARFLFSEAVHRDLKLVYSKWADFHALKANMDHTFQTQGHYGEGNPQKAREALEWFVDRFTTLPTVFEEMRLGVG